MQTPTFDRTVGILVHAYLTGTLLKGDCFACAVGNICAQAVGTATELVPDLFDSSKKTGSWGGYIYPRWWHVFSTNRKGRQRLCADDYLGLAKEQIDATGYSWQQLARIEYAFETAAPGYSEEAEYAGLLAVVDVLAELHGLDLTTAAAAKALFVRA